MTVSASNFPQVYEDLGIDTGRLGCIMLDTEPITVGDVIPENDLWVKDGQEDYLKGYVSERVPHVTLLFGLMRSGQEMQKHVDTVLGFNDGLFMPAAVEIEQVGFFYAKDPADKYVTIVAHVKVSDELKEANGRLRMLPHIDTFMDYKPHISLAYVKDTADWAGYIETLNKRLAGKSIKALQLNYGD